MRKPITHVTLSPVWRPLVWKTILGLCLILLLNFDIEAQRPQYKIHATLDTSAHILSGSIEIVYTNKSTVPLTALGLHLWPNAYSRKNTALVKQTLLMGSLDLYRAEADEMGGITGFDFTADGKAIILQVDTQQIDIGWLVLDKPLEPNATILLSTPFTVKVPASFSRLGRTGVAYQMTQWYPHLAVLDDKGWHTMPYLDNGEYFNDFADYEVSLTLPLGYSVATTGTMTSKTDQERATVWTFNAQNVIDFAWFASPTFRHEKTFVDVGRDEPIEVNVFTEPSDSVLWNRASAYAVRALQFFSEWLGPYPYPQMTVVSSPLAAGGGMEYPMVAQIGLVYDTTYLDIIIAHEIGHTWLYGILANDERTYPWLDEGLTSFLEKQYTSQYQPTYTENYIPGVFRTSASMDDVDELVHRMRGSHTLHPPQANPQEQDNNQYFLSAYHLPALGLSMMKNMLGDEMMKAMFRRYYADHKFTHVTPEDLQTSFQRACDCDLTWFFEDWIHHAHEVDYRLEKFSAKTKEITIVNHGKSEIPVRITSYKDDKPVFDRWISGFTGQKIIHLDDRADKVLLQEGFLVANKELTSSVRPYSWIPRIGLFPKIESYASPTIGITPVIGRNLADGFMAGVALTSGLFPQQHFKFFIAPMYGFESKKLRGHATMRYVNDLKGGLFDKYLLSFAVDEFGYNLDTHYLFRDHFLKWEPTMALRVKPNKDHSHIIQWLKYRYVHIDQFYGRGINYEAKIYTDEHRAYGIHELGWQMRSDFILRPFETQANIQTGKGFVRLNVTHKQHFPGKTTHLGTWIRGYGGWLPVFDETDASVIFTINGQSSYSFFSRDYMYDQWLGGRNAESGIFSHQVFEKDAHLKTLSNAGLGDQWMVGAGVSHAYPLRFLHVYMDAALYPSAVTEKVQLSYSGGIAIVLLKDVFEIYIPLLESKDIRESLSYEVRDMWFDRVSFVANIKLANPVTQVDRTQLGF